MIGEAVVRMKLIDERLRYRASAVACSRDARNMQNETEHPGNRPINPVRYEMSTLSAQRCETLNH